MKIKELIKILSKYDQDLVITVRDDEYGPYVNLNDDFYLKKHLAVVCERGGQSRFVGDEDYPIGIDDIVEDRLVITLG